MENGYHLPPGVFCVKFVAGVEALFKTKYRTLGASVTK
jgi:hypothetical protein